MATAWRWDRNWPIWSSPGIKRSTTNFALLAASLPILTPGDSVTCLTARVILSSSWRTTEVTVKPLCEVDEAFAWDEGEGDRTRDWWVAAHRRYFGRQASREGFELDDDILTVFERS